MAIEFHCPDCSKLLRTSEDKAGQTANCPACGSPVSVPRIEAESIDLSVDDIYDDEDIYDDDDSDDGVDHFKKQSSPSSSPPLSSSSGKKDFDSVFGTAAGATGYQKEVDAFDDDDDDQFGDSNNCSMCGATNSASANKCSRCGETLSYSKTHHDAYSYAPHRGGLILGLGIASFMTCCIFLGVASWLMGNEDIREMDAGRMDPTGRDITQAGRILGIVSVVLQGAIVLFFCCIGGLAG